MKRILFTLATLGLLLPSAAFAEKAGHKYVWTSAVYNWIKPGMSFGGDVTCYDYHYSVSCSKSPTFSTPAREVSQRLSIHVDCTDRTYDAKGDRKPWRSWNHAPNLYQQFYYACN